ncbi:SDR family NAD(P)-dependent oxidoreductase [Streptacidiphilus cavernicola]|uniref:SDR family NAD(P)-dependent oxidoreductase n=1 Tax=Streptacidiphilus cavernicola TaxID=3342716 RepID=A0ABV6W569_9ACTN
MGRFSSKRVVLTGGATGIGRATALAFAREGAAVMIGDIDDRAKQTVEIIIKSGGTAAFQRTDVSDPVQATALVQRCVDEFGGLDAAFNNAGVLPPTKAFHEMSQDDFNRVIEVDVKGVFNCMQAELRHMLEHGGGAIVNTTSVAGVIADPGMAPYVAAKHAVVGLTKAAGVEYARNGIRVNAIAPGLVRTPMTDRWLTDEDFSKAFLAASPIGRPAEPEEMTGLVLHLCSDEATFTNAQVFVMDGGQTAH